MNTRSSRRGRGTKEGAGKIKRNQEREGGVHENGNEEKRLLWSACKIESLKMRFENRVRMSASHTKEYCIHKKERNIAKTDQVHVVVTRGREGGWNTWNGREGKRKRR